VALGWPAADPIVGLVITVAIGHPSGQDRLSAEATSQDPTAAPARATVSPSLTASRSTRVRPNHDGARPEGEPTRCPDWEHSGRPHEERRNWRIGDGTRAQQTSLFTNMDPDAGSINPLRQEGGE
jgi:hypothetical protein